MAIYEPGPLIGRMRGRLGGLVATNARSAPVLRTYRHPVDPSRSIQNSRRALFSILAARWRQDLTAAQRDGWDALAATALLRNSLGNKFHPTGREMFFRVNVFLPTPFVTRRDDAPANPFPFWPSTAASLDGINNVILDVTDTTTGFAQLVLKTNVSGPLAASRNRWSGPWRLTRQTTLWPTTATSGQILPASVFTTDGRYFFEITPGDLNGAVGFKQLYFLDVVT